MAAQAVDQTIAAAAVVSHADCSAVQRSVRGCAPGMIDNSRRPCHGSCSIGNAAALITLQPWPLLTQSHRYILHLIDCNQSVLCSAEC